MLEIYSEILARAEMHAKKSNSFESVLDILRELPLEDFGLFLFGMPNDLYPALSNVLPSMPNDNIQKLWTGYSGEHLFEQTAAFSRILINNFFRYAGRSLQDCNIMDFGVGYGRIFRMMYYFSSPDRLWGVDAWQKSLDLCLLSRLQGNFVLSQSMPIDLLVGQTKFDLIFSFSVFTHLSPKAAAICLGTLRKYIQPNGLLILTIRPIEIWQIFGVEEYQQKHQQDGLAHRPHPLPEGETYGDTSLNRSFFETEDWTCVALDRSVVDPYQVACILKPL